jgi:hypothetical protein
MPEGSVEVRDCEKATACCPAPTVCEGEECGPEGCVANGGICTLLWFGSHCCADQGCTPGIVPVVTSCHLPCATPQQCHDLDAGPVKTLVCAPNAEACTFIGNCCTQKACDSDADCPSPTPCGGVYCQRPS